MESKESQLRDFEVISKIGQGAFGQVFRVRRKSDKLQYALKKVKLELLKEKQRENALNQIRIMASYVDESDVIIGFKEAFFDHATKCLCIVMEYAQKGDLLKSNQNHIRARTKYPQQEIWNALIALTQGLKALHDRKILHRDLKSANVFITVSNQYKLGDLNVSKVLKKDLADTQTGTPYYASPQVWKDLPYGAKSDIWSLGCVIYQMTALKPPFVAGDLKGLYRKVCAGKFDRISTHYSEGLNTIVSNLLSVDPAKRPTADQILSNSIVIKHLPQNPLENNSGVQNNSLLKTIKCNLKNIKDLKTHLPKASYTKQIKEEQKVEQKKIPKAEIIDEEQILKRKKEIEDKQKIMLSKVMIEQQKNVEIKKQKVFSVNEKVVRIKAAQHQNFSIHDPKIVVIKQGYHRNNPSKKAVYFEDCPINYHIISKNKQVHDRNIHKNHSLLVSAQKPQIDYKIPPQPNTDSKKPSVTDRINPTLVNNYMSNNKPQQSKKSKDNLNLKDANRKGHQVKTEEMPVNKNRGASQYRVVYPSWWG